MSQCSWHTVNGLVPFLPCASGLHNSSNGAGHPYCLACFQKTQRWSQRLKGSSQTDRMAPAAAMCTGGRRWRAGQANRMRPRSPLMRAMRPANLRIRARLRQPFSESNPPAFLRSCLLVGPDKFVSTSACHSDSALQPLFTLLSNIFMAFGVAYASRAMMARGRMLHKQHAHVWRTETHASIIWWGFAMAFLLQPTETSRCI